MLAKEFSHDCLPNPDRIHESAAAIVVELDRKSVGNLAEEEEELSCLIEELAGKIPCLGIMMTLCASFLLGPHSTVGLWIDY